MDEILIKEVLTEKQLNEFLYLPSNVHKDEPDWLPPIYMDDRTLFNKRKTGHTNMQMPCCTLLTGTINRRQNNGPDKQEV
jgi:hypothetical protein